MNEKYLHTGRKKQKLKTQQRILVSAQRFLNEGQDFTLEDVATQAGLSRATIYRYYSNVEVLSLEAGLDLNVQSPESILRQLDGQSIQDMILSIQDYYNRFTLDNEAAFRKFLSVVISADEMEGRRGARRIRALKLAFEEIQVDLKPSDINKLTHVATLLMGIEAIIVTKDVCRLSDEDSLQSLKWGLTMMLRGVFNQQQT